MHGKVVSLRWGSGGEPFDVRIDRKTPWGNPFVLGRHGNREEVISMFRAWATTSQDPRAVWIRDHVHELYGMTLACWCAPEACHGEVLLEMAADATGH